MANGFPPEPPSADCQGCYFLDIFEISRKLSLRFFFPQNGEFGLNLTLASAAEGGCLAQWPGGRVRGVGLVGVVPRFILPAAQVLGRQVNGDSAHGAASGDELLVERHGHREVELCVCTCSGECEMGEWARGCEGGNGTEGALCFAVGIRRFKVLYLPCPQRARIWRNRVRIGRLSASGCF